VRIPPSNVYVVGITCPALGSTELKRGEPVGRQAASLPYVLGFSFAFFDGHGLMWSYPALCPTSFFLLTG